MQNYISLRTPGPSGLISDGIGGFYAVPTHNRFAQLAPVDEWVGYSMNIDEDSEQTEQMDIDTVRNKRRRFNTGQTDMHSFGPEIDAKFSFICDKLEKLERANQNLTMMTHNMTTIQTQVTCIENQNSEQNRFLICIGV